MLVQHWCFVFCGVESRNSLKDEKFNENLRKHLYLMTLLQGFPTKVELSYMCFESLYSTFIQTRGLAAGIVLYRNLRQLYVFKKW